MGAAGNLVLLAIAFVVVGVGLLLLSLVCLRPKQGQALGYVTTPGTVKGAELVAPPGGEPTGYQPRITWAYEVTGVTYGVKGYDLTGATGTKDWAEDIVTAFPEGAACTVYYDPDHPERSVLKSPGEAASTICLGTFDILGFVVLGIGVVLGIVAAIFASGHGGR